MRSIGRSGGQRLTGQRLMRGKPMAVNGGEGFALLENPPCMYVLVVAHTKASLRRYIKTLFETILRTHQNVTVFDTLST